jgi:hypothetical protein
MLGVRLRRQGVILAISIGSMVAPLVPSGVTELPDRCLTVPVPYPNMSWQVDGYCHFDAPMQEFRTVVTCGDGELAHGNWVRRGFHSVAGCPRIFDKRFPKSMDIESR